MRNLGKSVWPFFSSVWFVLAAMPTLFVDPLELLKWFGIVKPDFQIFADVAQRQMAAGVVIVFLMFVWFHRQRIAYDDRQPDRPTMSFPALIQYVSQESKWAASRQKANDANWIKEMLEEVRRALLMEELSGYGVCERRPDGSRDQGPSKIPLSFWQEADLEIGPVYDPSIEHITGRIKLNFPVYSSVRFDPQKVEQVWPRRGIFAVIHRRSPAERSGFAKDWKKV